MKHSYLIAITDFAFTFKDAQHLAIFETSKNTITKNVEQVAILQNVRANFVDTQYFNFYFLPHSTTRDASSSIKLSASAQIVQS